MPPAIIGAVVAIGAAAGAAAGIITATTALVIGIAASAAGALLTKTQSFNFDSYTPQSERKQVIRAAAASRTVIYGTTVSSGVLVFAEEEPGVQEPDKHGENHEKLTLVLALAGHELTEVGQVWLGDDAIESFGDKASYVIHNNPTKVSQDMLNRCPSWKSDMIGKGICWMQLNLVFDSEKFPSGLPNVKCLKKGRKVLDPRTGKMVFSNNAALVILDYLRVYLKRSDDAILWDQFKEAANICDESVKNADNTFEPRYTINGEFDIDEAPSKILEDMLDSCGGELTYIGGKHGLLVGAYYGPPELTLDTSCIAGDIKITPETAFKERTNTITGTYIDPLQNYQEADFPPVSVAEWIQQDGQEITQDVDYRFVTSPYQAQRLSNLTLKRKRIGRSIEIPCNMRGYRFRPGMYVYVDIPNIGMNKVEMRVIKWQFDPKGGVTVTVRQDFPDLWDDAIGKPVERPDLVDLPTGGAMQPQNLQYEVLQISDVVQGVLSWQNIMAVAYNNVIIKKDGATVLTVQVPGQSTRITGLIRGAYTAHVKAVAYTGATSPEAYLEFNIQAPSAPTSVEVTQGYFAVTLKPKSADLANVSTQYDFWTSGETRLPSAAVDVVEAQATRAGMGTTWTSEGLLNDHTYYWYVRAINAFGSSSFVEVAARCFTDAAGLIPQIDTEFKGTNTYKELMAEIGSVSDGVKSYVDDQIETSEGRLTQTIDTVQQSVVLVDGKVQQQGVTINEQGQLIDAQGKLIETNGQQINVVKATVQEVSKSVVDLEGNVNAQWGAKIQVDSKGQKYVAGIQLGMEGSGGAIQSYFMVNANNFAIYNPTNSTADLAFAVKNGQVFMKATFIENGSIDNAKIGNYIQSNNYVAGSAGWKLNKAGDAEFNNVTVRGIVYASGGRFTGEIQATSGKFKGTVEATSFIGDVCNMGVADDLYGEGGTYDMTRTITYRDTANTTKTITVMANLSGVPKYPGMLLGVEITVNGVTKSASAGTSVRDTEGGMLSTSGTVMATFKGVTAATVTAKIVFKEGATHRWLRSPTMIVTRGSGSFSYS